MKALLDHALLNIFCFLSVMTSLAETAPQEFVVDRFSNTVESNQLPRGWKTLQFEKVPNHTHYTLEKEGNDFFVKAVSQNSASAIYKEVHLSPKDYPILSWRWKIENVLKKSDPTKKSGDDYPARVYVAFEYVPSHATFWEKTKYTLVKLTYGQFPPKAALNYIWDSKLPIGKSLDNAYTDRTKMIVLESGEEKITQWVKEERNIFEDYKKLFGSEPPPISFIALMTDTDNTGESVIAYFDDIVLKRG